MMAAVGPCPSRLFVSRNIFFKIRLLLNDVTAQRVFKFKKLRAPILHLSPSHFRFTYGLVPLVFAASVGESINNKEQEPDMAAILKDADALYDERDYKQAYGVLISLKDDANDEILWRLARVTFEMAKLAASSEEKKTLNTEAFKYAQKALDFNPKNFASHKWMAILLDCVSEYEGTKARITKSEQVKRHIELATELNPSDPTSFYLLGMWCFSVADLPWYQRQIASVVFATPPVSSYEEAIAAFEKAEEIEPKFYSMNHLMLGKCYLQLNQKQKAIDSLNEAVSFPLLTEDDKKAHREAKDLLKSLGVTS